MADAHSCPKCGSPRPGSSTQDLCPSCSTEQGQPAADPDGTAAYSPSARETLTLTPPNLSVLTGIGEIGNPAPRVLLRDAPNERGIRSIAELASNDMPGPAKRYQLFGEIGRGGMGAILRGRDIDLGRELAIKVLLDSHREKPELVKRFVEEAQIGGQLQHPGVAPVYDLGAFADRRPFFTMKLVRGKTLADMLRARSSPADDLPRFLSIFQSICQTMAYAHDRGVIHRDLKPSNVMVGSFGEVQVMDWGLAKVLSRGQAAEQQPKERDDLENVMSTVQTARSGSDADASRAGSVLGTPAYMAPEQARGEIDLVDERADVFGLGAILCEVLTGLPAFTGRTMFETMSKASRGDLADAFTRLDAAGVERELIDLAKTCLAAAREDRPRHAQAVAEQVTAYLTGVQERLRRSELARVEERGRQRLRMAVAASILVIFGLGGSAWAYVAQFRAARRNATERGVTTALDEANLYWGQARSTLSGDLSPWSAALNAAKRAEGLLAGGEAGAGVRERVQTVLANVEHEQAQAQAKLNEARRDRELLERLEAIRGARSEHWKAERTVAEYAEAFRDFGIDFVQLAPIEAGRLLGARSAPVELASFLDDWSSVLSTLPQSQQGELRSKLIAAASVADPDSWRKIVRTQIVGGDPSAMPRLADDQKALEGQPSPSLLLLAQGLLDLGDRAKAEAILHRAWRQQPNDYWVNDALGYLYFWSPNGPIPKRPAVAARYYSAAVAIRPRSIAAHTNLGQALCPNSLDEGIAELEEAVRLKPNSAPAHANLGIALTEKGKLPEMIAEYREALRLDPSHSFAHEGLAIGLYRQGKLGEAILELREALGLNPDNEKAHNNLAWALAIDPRRSAREYEEAVIHARKAVEMQPADSTFQGTRALAELRAGHWAEGIASAEQSLALKKSGDSATYFVLALASWRNGDRDKAVAGFDRGVDWAQKHPPMDDDQRRLWKEAADLLGRPGPSPMGPSPARAGDAPKPR